MGKLSRMIGNPFGNQNKNFNTKDTYI